MVVLVTYDVSTVDAAGRRLRQVAKVCEDFGQRVQNSVFECLLEPADWVMLKAKLLKIYEPTEDSLRFYFLGRNWRRRVEHHGAKKMLDPEKPIIV
jgi:CRISPR-associated protein Cas2